MSNGILCVLLHGLGANGDDLASLADELRERVLPGAEFLHPDGFHPFDQAPVGRQWFSRTGLSDSNRGARGRAAAAEVETWIRERLDGRDLVIGGFSQGSLVALATGVARLPPPLAILGFSGRFSPDLLPERTAVPILLVHGEEDEIIAVEHARAAARGLESRGAEVELLVLPGVGHTIDTRAVDAAVSFLTTIVAR